MSEYEGVEDSLLISLTARVNISRKFPEYFCDEKAFEMANLFNGKEIEKKSSEYSMMASVARYYNMDQRHRISSTYGTNAILLIWESVLKHHIME